MGLSSCEDPESFVRGGPTLTFFVCLFVCFLVDDFFLVDERRMDKKNPLKAGHHRPTSETPLNGVSLVCR